MPENKDGLNLAQVIYKGDMLLLYENTPNEINWNNNRELNKRLFQVVGLSIQKFTQGGKNYQYGIVTLKHHMEARKISDLKMADGAFKLHDNKIFRKLNHNQINCLVAENAVNKNDFKFNIDGTIELIQH